MNIMDIMEKYRIASLATDAISLDYHEMNKYKLRNPERWNYLKLISFIKMLNIITIFPLILSIATISLILFLITISIIILSIYAIFNLNLKYYNKFIKGQNE